jgi:hypothetical protein
VGNTNSAPKPPQAASNTATIGASWASQPGSFGTFNVNWNVGETLDFMDPWTTVQEDEPMVMGHAGLDEEYDLQPLEKEVNTRGRKSTRGIRNRKSETSVGNGGAQEDACPPPFGH